MKRTSRRTKRAPDDRRRDAFQKALALTRKLERMERETLDSPEEETDRADEISEVAEKLLAVFAEYPDVFPDPPVPEGVARAHIAALKEANAEVRKNQEELASLAKQREEAERQLDAMLAEVAAPRKKPDLSN